MTYGQHFLHTFVAIALCVPLSTRAADVGSIGGFPGDANADGRVDLADYVYWLPCATDPGQVTGTDPCPSLDIDTDGDVDLADFSQFLEIFRDPICGNGIEEEGEQCDSGGESALCDTDCTLAECGDGVLNATAGEACDDGNAFNGDGCRMNCTIEMCGDGILDVGEDCDDGGESASCDSDCTAAECGDGVLNATAGEACDDGNAFNGDGCRINCTIEVCGDGILDNGEECDPPDAAAFCGPTCQYVISGMILEDSCGGAVELSGEGLFAFDNLFATQDGPAHTGCTFFGEDQIDHDVWACWSSPCTGTVLLETCDFTTVDTKIAVYDGCNCPGTDAALLSCSDDVCSSQTRLLFQAVAGSSYLIRLGTFPSRNPGFGIVKITCGVDNCPGEGDCFVGSDTPGCNDAGCCETTCAKDPFCCTTQWDSVCADEALGYCSGAFAACAPGAGSCTESNGSPGCDDETCCNAVCRADPLCCLETWDAACAEEEAAYCHSSCGPGAGACHEANGTPGCEDPACCDQVCVRDPFCCQTGWDVECLSIANEWCAAP